MAAFDFSTVPNNILADWMRSTLTGNQDDLDGFLAIIKMSDADKASNFQTYLSSRVSNNSAQSTLISDAATAAQSSLTSDTSTCDSLISTLSSITGM